MLWPNAERHQLLLLPTQWQGTRCQMARCRLYMARNLVMVCAHTNIAAAVQQIAQAGMWKIYGWMSTQKQTLATKSRLPSWGYSNIPLMCSGVGRQQTRFAEHNCIVLKVQKQRYTALREQHDSMQDAHMSCTRVPGNIRQASNWQTSHGCSFQSTIHLGSTLCAAHLAFVWMKSNSQLLVLAFDGQGIYTSFHLHRQHAVDANQHAADKRSTGGETCHRLSLLYMYWNRHLFPVEERPPAHCSLQNQHVSSQWRCIFALGIPAHGWATEHDWHWLKSIAIWQTRHCWCILQTVLGIKVLA